MLLRIRDRAAFAATGGRAHVPGQPCVAFVHGAGFNHEAWALQSRWFAFHGCNVLAVDLPGHGRSEGEPLDSVAALAGWLLELLDAAGARRARLVGHSMGSLVCLEAAAAEPRCIERLALIGAAAAMKVHPDLLAAARASEHSAIDMINLWGHGPAVLGGSRAPGIYMAGVGERILEQARPGVLHADLALCDAYGDALERAARIRAPTLLVSGTRDQMTPLKGARRLSDAIAGSRLVAVEGAGHMLMAERPDELLQALAPHLRAAQ